MGYEENEQEIDLKAMFFDALYRWRSILVAGLIGALLLGAYKYWSVNKAAASLEEAIAEGTVIESDFDKGYLQAKEKIEAKEAERRTQSKKSTDLQKQINDAKKKIADNNVSITAQQNAITFNKGQIENTQILLDDAQDYLNNSVLMQAAEDRPMMTRIYKVTLPENTDELLRDPADEIVASYVKPLAGEKKIADLQQKYGLTGDLMEELYDALPDLDANTITVTAYGKDEAMAKEVLGAVCGVLEEKKEKMSKLHTLTKVTEHFERGKDPEVLEMRDEYKSKALNYANGINSYKTAIESAQTAIESLQNDIANLNVQVIDYEREKKICDEQVYLLSNEIAKMEQKMPSMVSTATSRVKSAVKWAILGFIAGCAVLFIVYIVLYVVRPLLRMPDDIRTVYGYPVLGVLNKKVREKVCAIDKWIMKAEGRGQRPGDDEIVKTAAVSIAKTAEPGSLVAVMTTLKENNTITQIAEQLKGLVPEMQFVLLTEGISKASNVDELSRCDATVLLEERNATSMGKLTADVNQIRLFNKKVLGAIVL